MFQEERRPALHEERGLKSLLTWSCKPEHKCRKTRFNGPDDAVVSEMIKQMPQEKIYIVTKCFQERFMGKVETPKFLEDCEAGVSAKTRRRTKKTE